MPAQADLWSDPNASRLIHGPTPMPTARCWRDGRLHTVDMARVDDKGRFYFKHRMSDRIRVRGEMVSAYEVEKGALTHPEVEDCAVIGVPGELVEEDIRRFVVLKPGARLLTVELRTHCAERMAHFMVPRDIVFIEELPRTPTGKPEKGNLTAAGTAVPPPTTESSGGVTSGTGSAVFGCLSSRRSVLLSRPSGFA